MPPRRGPVRAHDNAGLEIVDHDRTDAVTRRHVMGEHVARGALGRKIGSARGNTAGDAENQNRDCLERAHATQLSAKYSSAFYTNALRCRGQSPGNINRGARLERAGITGSIVMAGPCLHRSTWPPH